MLKEWFPSWAAVLRYREVVLFAVGLMKDPRPLVDHVYQMQVEAKLNGMRRIGGFENIRFSSELFRSLYVESPDELLDHPLHNKHINYYDHEEDDEMRGTRDTTPVFIPSSYYEFSNVKEDVQHNKLDSADQVEWGLSICNPMDQDVTQTLLKICEKICSQWPVTDVEMLGVKITKFPVTVEAPIMSAHARSLTVYFCTLPVGFLKNILHQLIKSQSRCVTLQSLKLVETDLSEVEGELDKLMEKLVCHHEKSAAQRKLKLNIYIGGWNNLSAEFVQKWMARCGGITTIECSIDVIKIKN